eukprot:TRINITY_DN53039_c0_g1_i1.p1 TRINITY_DN53039_c0_g1~~TRINITY_DN53039_c0_g1_i1.p1  ORF type:complete len:194 (+),score=26.23 TRINITY_DN53039_c0_g1_i1:24-605(+)
MACASASRKRSSFQPPSRRVARSSEPASGSGLLRTPREKSQLRSPHQLLASLKTAKTREKRLEQLALLSEKEQENLHRHILFMQSLRASPPEALQPPTTPRPLSEQRRSRPATACKSARSPPEAVRVSPPWKNATKLTKQKDQINMPELRFPDSMASLYKKDFVRLPSKGWHTNREDGLLVRRDLELHRSAPV